MLKVATFISFPTQVNVDLNNISENMDWKMTILFFKFSLFRLFCNTVRKKSVQTFCYDVYCLLDKR